MANYISNKEFYEHLVVYKQRCKLAEQNGKPVPIVSNEIANCFMMIANKLSTKACFSGYTYKDEMVGDAIENCLRAVHNFNPDEGKNPFAYFTQITWFAFLRRIQGEKKQTYIKYKALEHAQLEDLLEGGDAYTNFSIENDKMNPIIEKFEKKPKKRKSKSDEEDDRTDSEILDDPIDFTETTDSEYES